MRRRADAKQRFLKEDLAKLLSNGLDINAYGRTEEFLAGMNLLSCYDFIDQSCEYILKQLSRMQKHGDCPDECRQAVASLMFAAARFSDLPELRDLRDLFQQKYGNCLDSFVNQKFVEKLSSSPFAAETRLKVLQDIASEYSVKWDFRGFEKRMVTPSVTAQVHLQKSPNPEKKDGVGGYKAEVSNIMRRDRIYNYADSPNKSIESIDKTHAKREASSSHGDRSFPEKLSSSTVNKPTHHVEIDYKPERLSNHSSHGPSKVVPKSAKSREEAKTEKNSSHNGSIQPDTMHTTRKGLQGNNDMSKYAIPPPYVKSDKDIHRIPNHDGSYRNSIEKTPACNSDHDKQFLERKQLDKNNDESKYAMPPPYMKSDKDKHRISKHDGSNNPIEKASACNSDHDKQFLERKLLDNHHHEKIPLPKPRSIRKKPNKSSSVTAERTTDDDDDANNVKGSNSRRKDHSRKGLQVLFEEEHQRVDREEMMIDKLLIHYSKKPSTYDARKLKKKVSASGKDGDEHHSESSSTVRSRDGKCSEPVMPHPSRSVSLPSKQRISSPEKRKVFARANTFEPGVQAPHVHPKLPDYDDLAARFAALKGS